MRFITGQHARSGLVLAILLLGAANPGIASSADGKISVLQVVQMVDQAPSNSIARQVLTAYLSGVGEAAGHILNKSGSAAPCRKPLTLDSVAVRRALEAASPDRDAWSSTPATPLILRDMLQRAGCAVSG